MFASFQNGMSELVDALVRRIEAAGSIRRDTPIRGLRRSADTGEGWTLETADGRSLPFDAVVRALPAHRAAALLTTADANLSAALGAIEYASSAIVVTGHRERDVDHPLAASGLVIPAVERRRILSVSFASRKFAGRAGRPSCAADIRRRGPAAGVSPGGRRGTGPLGAVGAGRDPGSAGRAALRAGLASRAVDATILRRPSRSGGPHPELACGPPAIGSRGERVRRRGRPRLRAKWRGRSRARPLVTRARALKASGPPRRISLSIRRLGDPPLTSQTRPCETRAAPAP